MKAIGILLFTIVALTRGAEFECPSDGGAYPHPESCELYYLCVNHEPTLKKCPAGQLFDLVYDGCNWEYLVDCQDRERPGGGTNPPSPTENPGDEFDCPTPGGAFPHDKFCELYYVCVENVSTLKECPAKQLFDLVYSGCNWEELVDCGDRIRPTKPTPPPGDFECPAPGGAYPHPEDCTLYYICEEYRPYLRECPPRQLFDLVYSGCNWEQYVDCGNRTSPPPETTRPSTTTKRPGTGPTSHPGFECPTPDGLFANPDDCTSFFQCTNYVAVLNHCPDNLHFNAEYTICDFPANVDCGDRPIPSRQ